MLFNSVTPGLAQGYGGFYTPTGPMGGTAADPDWTYNYTGDHTGYGGRASWYAAGSVNCSGPVSTTYNYQQLGDWDKPPQEVIVKESCSATFFSGGVGPSGSCANDLGSPEYDSEGQDLLSGSSSGTRYRIVAGGPQVIITASPHATAASGGPGGANGPVCNASVNYSVDVLPITISLSGATPNGTELDVLTGQQITATLNVPTGYTASNYAWTTAAGDAFKTYNENAATNQLAPLTTADTSGPGLVAPFSFYTRSDETADVSCTATLTFPDGTTAPITARTALTSLKPMVVVTVNENVPNLSVAARPGSFISPPANPQPGLFGFNEYWMPATITVPAPFIGGTPPKDQGMGSFAQILTPAATHTRDSALCSATYVLQITNPNGGYMAPGTGLDGSFPYPTGFASDVPDAQGNFVISGTTPYHWDASTPGYSGDSPHDTYIPSIWAGDACYTDQAAFDTNTNNYITNGWYAVNDSWGMTVWVMYKPAPAVNGQNTVWVPLQNMAWGCSRELTLNRDATQTWTTTQGPVFNPGMAFTSTNDPPQWTRVEANFVLAPP